MIDARRRIPLAVLAGLASGIALSALGFLVISAGNPWLFGQLNTVILLPMGGAAAGLVATMWILFERRFLAGRLYSFLGGLMTYYLGVFTYWLVMSSSGLDAGFSFAEWRAWLLEVVKDAPLVFAFATWPFGLVTIPLCFLLRKWIIRICDPRPAPADTMSA